MRRAASFASLMLAFSAMADAVQETTSTDSGHAFPSRPVRMIVSNTPGSAPDELRPGDKLIPFKKFASEIFWPCLRRFMLRRNGNSRFCAPCRQTKAGSTGSELSSACRMLISSPRRYVGSG